MNFQKLANNRFLQSKRSRLLAFIALVLILAITIPPTVVVPLRKENMGPKSKVFVPLYVYPAPGAWTPLENVVATHPSVNFNVVINPGNGPGPNALPDANYTREIPRLALYSNVRLLGYVPITYTNRDIGLVRRDVETYAGWPVNGSNPDLAVQGIFFDETPQEYDDRALGYFQELRDLVKGSSGLGPDNQVFHNPGVVPDSRYLSTADSIVVFEATYDTFQERRKAKVFKTLSDNNRGQLCAVIHSVPDSIQGSKLRSLVKEARKVAEEVYVTHLRVDYYAGFGHSWGDFVDLMAA
ncbi:spherulation-specific family 4 protein [Aspergillus glaucus CBS 516.65]|uniref:Cell surface spherulin 4-like protein n=1 Tax=Aspergillus glaucus CBS 516.65 TaxID=1160497 RepID=A0A1L9VKG7_ASPGL|nr:hypothetical protein ASPGLDRAFT_47280 [Aspergillus glaucus CBS 516.65]OJJ84394.1 hypothetical protein ASPGLDRAFT_47280 [Aspergillus glaucus CBS 516.65]